MTTQALCFFLGAIAPLTLIGWLIQFHWPKADWVRTEQAGQTGRTPSPALATIGFLGSTFLTAALMLLVSAI